MDDFLGFEVDDGDAEILVEDVRDRALPGKYDRLSRLIESSYGPDGLVGASVDDGESVVDLIAGVKASTVRAEGRPVRIPSDRHRRASGVRLQIDHRDRVGATVGGIQGRVVVGDGDGADAIETDDLTDGFEGCRLDYRDLVAGEVGDKESSAGVIELDSLAGLGKAGEDGDGPSMGEVDDRNRVRGLVVDIETLAVAIDGGSERAGTDGDRRDLLEGIGVGSSVLKCEAWDFSLFCRSQSFC